MKAAHLINQIDDPIINCTVYLKTLFEYLGKDILGKHVMTEALPVVRPKQLAKDMREALQNLTSRATIPILQVFPY